MTEAESLYFDLTRVCAALFVLVGHAVIFFPEIMPVRDYGHFAVDAFFVLSGYVIANVADTKERTLHRYVVSRTARIFSVALPAIILTLVCDWIGRHGNGAALYNPYPGSQPLVRIGAAATFTSELWFESIQLFSNGPYWSLCYEVWYYAIFAAATYLSGSRRWHFSFENPTRAAAARVIVPSRAGRLRAPAPASALIMALMPRSIPRSTKRVRTV